MRDGFWGALVTLAALGSVACSLLAPSDAELGSSGGAANDGAAGGSCAAEPVAAIPQSAGIVLVVDGHGGLKQLGGAFAEVQKGVSQFAHDERVAGTRAALVRPREFCCQGITADPAMDLLATNADAIDSELATDGIASSVHNVYTAVRNHDLYCKGADPCLMVLMLGGAPGCDETNCDGPPLTERIAALSEPVYVLDVAGGWSDDALASVAAAGAIVEATNATLIAERLLDIAACRYERPAGASEIELSWVSALGADPQPLTRVSSIEACSAGGWVLDAAGITLCAKTCESVAPGGTPIGEIQMRACP